MLTESELFYYIGLAIVCFIIMYIMYITLHLQNNVIESFSIGGGGKDKKEKKTKESKAVEAIEQEITVLEDVLKITDNKKDYDDILIGLKRKINLIALGFAVNTAGSSNDNDMKMTAAALAGLKHAHDGIDELIEFVDKE